MKPGNGTTGEFVKGLSKPRRQERYVLRLYVTGMTPRSTEALATIKTLCEEHLPGRYDLQVIDLYQQPALAQEAQIVAVPTLIKKFPNPFRRFIGNLATPERVLEALGLAPLAKSSSSG